MAEKVVYIFWGEKVDVDGIWWGIFAISQSIAKRMHFLLTLVDQVNTPNKAWYVRVVRRRTVKRAMLGIDKRCERLEEKIANLRMDPEKFRTIIAITVKLIMVKIEHEKPEIPVPPERVEKITTTPAGNFEVEAIVALLENFGFSRTEIFETVRWDTAKKIPRIDFDDVYKFLKKITQNPI